MDQRMKRQVDLVQKELLILSDPSSKLYPVIRNKIYGRKDEVVQESYTARVGRNERIDQRSFPIQVQPVPKQVQPVPKPVQPVPKPVQPRRVDRIEPRPKSPLKKAPKSSPIVRQTAKSLSRAKAPTPTISTPKKNDFVVPHIDSNVNETRSGLRSRAKDFKTDLEKMRLESDERLKIAIRKAALKQRQLLEEAELLKKKRMRILASSLPSRGSKPKASTKVALGLQKPKVGSSVGKGSPKLGKEAAKGSPKLGKENKETNVTVTLANPLKKKPLGSTKQNTPPTTNFLKKNILATANMSKKNSERSSPELGKRPKSKNSSRANTPDHVVRAASSASPGQVSKKSLESSTKASPNQAMVDKTQIVDDMMQMIGAKLDPVLSSVQQHWDKAVERIDSQLAHLNLSKMPEPTLQEIRVTTAEQQIQTEQDEVEVILIPNNVKHIDDQVMERKPVVKKAFEETIVIERNVVPKQVLEEVKVPRKELLVLPTSMVQSIVERRNVRMKFAETYFGYSESFHPNTAIEMYVEFI